MEISEFLDKLNSSELGRFLRAKHLQVSQNTIDEVNQKYGTKVTMDLLQSCVEYGWLESKLPQDMYKDITDANEFVFSDIEQLKEDLSGSMEFSLLTPENIEMLKEAFTITGANTLKINSVTQNIPDLSELPVEILEIYGGSLLPEDFSRLPDVSSLELFSVEFTSIGDLTVLKNLKELIARVHPTDPQLDMSQIGEFTGLTKLDISGQTLTQEEFEKICTLKGLEILDIGTGKINGDLAGDGHEIDDFSSILELSNLKDVRTNKLSEFCIRPVIQNVEEFRKLVSCKFFQEDSEKKVTYIGSEPLPADLLEGIEGVKLEILTPFAIGKEFAEKYEDGFPGSLKIISDSYNGYTAPEIYAVSQKMKEILDGIPKDASEFEKVAAVYKKIGELCFYDRTGCIGEPEYIDGREEITRSLKGGLLEQKLVCRGYSVVMKKLLDELGIDCKIVSGNALSELDQSNRGDHAWNQVKIDGQWYNMDLTWDARSIRAQGDLEFLLVRDEEFNRSHKAYNVDPDIRDCIHDGKLDYAQYRRLNNDKFEPHKCDQSYDKDKISEYFRENATEIKPSQLVVDDITRSETVTIAQIEDNMVLMAAVERDKDITEEKEQTEERNG